jgi:hypothetical protein
VCGREKLFISWWGERERKRERIRSCWLSTISLEDILHDLKCPIRPHLPKVPPHLTVPCKISALSTWDLGNIPDTPVIYDGGYLPKAAQTHELLSLPM